MKSILHLTSLDAIRHDAEMYLPLYPEMPRLYIFINLRLNFYHFYLIFIIECNSSLIL